MLQQQKESLRLSLGITISQFPFRGLDASLFFSFSFSPPLQPPDEAITIVNVFFTILFHN